MATPISKLQEYFAAKYEKLPEYFIESVGTISDVKFKCTVSLSNGLKAEGNGRSKQEAKHDSAAKALIMLMPGLRDDMFELQKLKSTLPPSTPAKKEHFQNYVGTLNEFASTRGHLYPNYKDEIIGLAEFQTICMFLNFVTTGHGRNKKDSKQESARNMLELLKTEKVDLNPSKPVNKKNELNVDDIKSVLDQYQKIQKFQLTGHKNNGSVNTNSTEFAKSLKKERTIKTEEELKTEMARRNIIYKMEVMQTQPFMISMTTASGKVIMGIGESRQKAVEDIISMVSDMIENEFSL